MAPTKEGARVSRGATVRGLCNGTWADDVNIHGSHQNVLVEGRWGASSLALRQRALCIVPPPPARMRSPQWAGPEHVARLCTGYTAVLSNATDP